MSAGPFVDIICKQCGRLAKAQKVNAGKFCSRACYYKWNSGENNYNYGKEGIWKGKRLSTETREKISKSKLGKPRSEELKILLSEKAKLRYQDPAMHIKTSESLKGKFAGKNNPMYGVRLCGKNNPNWQGGKSFEPYCPKFNNEFKERVRAFFNYDCMLCGKSEKNNNRKLTIHHIEYNKETCCDNSIPLFIVLCDSCHSKTNFNRECWEHIFRRIIEELYDGKCYFSKEEYDGRKLHN